MMRTELHSTGLNPELLKEYQKLPIFLKRFFPSVISAFNNGFLTLSNNIYKPFDILIKTDIPKFTKFNIDINNNDWYNTLTSKIALQKGVPFVDILYQGKPINLLPIEEFFKLVQVKTRFDVKVVDRKPLLESQEKQVSAQSMDIIKPMDLEMIVNSMMKDFMDFFTSSFEDLNNPLNAFYVLTDRNTTTEYVTRWINETSKMQSNLMTVIDPSPVITPIVNEFINLVQNDARITTKTMSGMPSTEKVSEVFLSYFNPETLVQKIETAMKPTLQSIGVAVSRSNSRTQRHREKKLNTWTYPVHRYDHISLGNEYSMDIQAQRISLNPNIGHRLFHYKDGEDGTLYKSSTKLSPNDFLYVELDPMLSKGSRVLSKLKNFATQARTGVIIALCAVSARGHTNYGKCYHLELADRRKDIHAITNGIRFPNIMTYKTYRILLWNESNLGWGDFFGKISSIPPPTQTITIEYNPSPSGFDTDNYPFINIEHKLFNKFSGRKTIEKEDLKKYISVLMNDYQRNVNDFDAIQKALQIQPDQTQYSDQESGLPFNQKISQTGIGLPIYINDKELGYVDVAFKIDEVSKKLGNQITDRMKFVTLQIFDQILSKNSAFPIKIYVKHIHNPAGKDQHASEYQRKGLEIVEEIIGVYAKKRHIYIFGINNVFLAFSFFLKQFETLLIPTIQKIYPNFQVDIKRPLSSLAKATGDDLDIDSDEISTSDPGKSVFNAVVQMSAMQAKMDKDAVDFIRGKTESIPRRIIESAETIFLNTFETVARPLENMIFPPPPDKPLPSSTMSDDPATPQTTELQSTMPDVPAATQTPETQSEESIPESEPQSDNGQGEVSSSDGQGEEYQPIEKETEKEKKLTRDYITIKQRPQSASSSSTSKNIGCNRVLNTKPIKTHFDVQSIDLMVEYQNYTDDFQDKSKIDLEVLQTLLFIKDLADVYLVYCGYENFKDLKTDDDDAVQFVANSKFKIAYLSNVSKVLIIIPEKKTMAESFWPWYTKSPKTGNLNCLINAVVLSSPIKIDIQLMDIESVGLWLAERGTDLVGKPINSVRLHGLEGSTMDYTLPSKDATLGDLIKDSGLKSKEFQITVGKKHHKKHGISYKSKHHGHMKLSEIYSILPIEYKEHGVLVLEAKEDLKKPLSRDMGINDLQTLKKNVLDKDEIYIYTNPTDEEYLTYKEQLPKLTSALFESKFMFRLYKKNKEWKLMHLIQAKYGEFKYKKVKNITYSIPKDLSSITINSQNFSLKKISNHPKIYKYKL